MKTLFLLIKVLLFLAALTFAVFASLAHIVRLRRDISRLRKENKAITVNQPAAKSVEAATASPVPISADAL